MTTGRQLIVAALREAMPPMGWAPRAAGWFTRPLDPRCTGVLAVSAAVEHAPAGTADVTVHVHLRRDDVEPVVAELCDVPDGGHRSTTASTSIGALMPGAPWRTWRVGPGNARAVGQELAAAVHDHADPHVERLAADPDALITAVRASPAMASVLGPCRLAVLSALDGRLDEALTVLDATLVVAAGRSDPAAEALRRMAERFRDRTWPAPGDRPQLRR